MPNQPILVLSGSERSRSNGMWGIRLRRQRNTPPKIRSNATHTSRKTYPLQLARSSFPRCLMCCTATACPTEGCCVANAEGREPTSGSGLSTGGSEPDNGDPR